jgi:hypothetical protein
MRRDRSMVRVIHGLVLPTEAGLLGRSRPGGADTDRLSGPPG